MPGSLRRRVLPLLVAWVLGPIAQGAIAKPARLATTVDDGATCPVVLRDAAADSGIDFRHRTGARGEKHLPETMGAGVAWIDADGDGWLDLYFVQSGPFPPDGSAAAANLLYRNLGVAGPPRFAPWPQSGSEERGYGQGALVGDLDGDRDLDLVITNDGPDVVLLNDGSGRFTARPLDAAAHPLWSSSAALADADGDGDLDLYVAGYLDYDPAHGLFCGDPPTGDRPARPDYCDPSMFAGAADRFYRSEGDGRFVDVTREAGLEGATGRGLGVVFSDLDGDGRPDLYVANDLTLNLLFRNVTEEVGGAPRFEDLSLLSGAAVNRDGKPEAGMGVIAADLDADGDVDLAVTNFDVETNTLYRRVAGPELFFEDVSAESGFGLPSFNRLGFGLVAGDFDLDGALDLYVANGHIFEQPKRDNVAYRQPDQLLLGDGAGGFSESSCSVEGLRAAVGRGAAAADVDLDGDLDLAVSNSDDVPFLLLGSPRAEDRRGFVGVELVGRAPNSQAVGARVTLEAGGRRQERWVQAGDSYLSSSDRRLLFAWRREWTEPGRLDVTWPGGARQRFVVGPRAGVGSVLRVVEGEGR